MGFYTLYILVCVVTALQSITSQQSDIEICNGEINLAVAMDASNSLGFYDFRRVVSFTRRLASRSNMNGTKFFVVSFGANVSDVIAETGSSNIDDIKNTLDTFKRISDGTGTETNLAIDRITDLLTKYGIQDRPNVGVVVTDGVSTGGSDKLRQSARSALNKGVTLIAVGVGTQFTTGDLLLITNDRPEHIIRSEFDELETIAVNKTLRKVCELSYYDQSVRTADECTETGDIAIALQIENIKSVFDIRSLMYLVERLSENTTIALLDGYSVHSVENKSTTIDYLVSMSDNDYNYKYDERTDSTAQLLRKAMGVFNPNRRIPKLIILLTDAIHATQTSLTEAIRGIKELKIELMVFLYGFHSQDSHQINEMLAMANVSRTNMLVHTFKSNTSLISSGYNQILARTCSVLRNALMPDLKDYGGLFDLAITLDMCNMEPKSLDQAVNYLEFARFLAENLVYSQWNMSLSVSISKCHPAFNIDVTRTQNYVHHAFYYHKSLSYKSRMTVGKESELSVSGLLGSFVTILKGPFYSTGILFITKEDDHLQLIPLINTAKEKGIHLIAIGVKNVHGITDETLLQNTVNLVDNSKLNLGILSLQEVADMRIELLLKIRDQIRLPGELIFGISDRGDLDVTELEQLNTFMSNLMNLVVKTENSTIIRAKVTDDINNVIKQERANVEAGLPNVEVALRFVKIYRELGRFNHGVIITNQMPQNCPATRIEASAAKNNNIKLHAIGWGRNNTDGLLCITNDDRDYVTYSPGLLSGSDLDAVVNKIDNSHNVAIMVDASRFTSDQDFNEALKLANLLIKKLGSKKVDVSASVVLFDDAVRVVMPLQPINGTTDIPYTLHLRWLYPAVQILKDMMTVVPPSTDVKRYGILLLDNDVLYESDAQLFTYVVKPILTLVPIDMTAKGNITHFEKIFEKAFIQRVGYIRYSNYTPGDFMATILHIINLSKSGKIQAFVEFGLKRQPSGTDLLPIETAIDKIIRAMYISFNKVDIQVHFADWDQMFKLQYLYNDNNNVETAINNVIRDFRLLHGINGSTNAIAQALMEVTETPWSHKKKVSAVVTNTPVTNKDAVQELVTQAKEESIHTIALGVGALDKDDLRSYVTNDSLLYITKPADLQYDGTRKVFEMLSLLTEPPILAKLCFGGKADIVIGIVLDEKDNPFELQNNMKTITKKLETESVNIRRKISITYSSRKSNVLSLNNPIEDKIFGDTMMYVAKELCNKLLAYNVNNGREKVAILIIDSKSFSMSKDYEALVELHQGPIKYIVVAIGDFTLEEKEDLRLLTNYIDENLVFIRNSKDLDFSNSDALMDSICDAAHLAERINITKICKDYMDPNIISNFFPNPYDCTAFIQCSMSVDGKNIEADLEHCPDGTRWDVLQKKCLPANQVNCFLNRGFLKNTATRPPSTAASIPIISQQLLVDKINISEICDEVCPVQLHPSVKAFNITAYPGNCFQYIYCERTIQHGISAILKTCDPGLFYNPKTKLCTEPHNVQCAADPCKLLALGEKKQWVVKCNEYQYCENGKTKLQTCVEDGTRLYNVEGELFCMKDDGTMPCHDVKVIPTCKASFKENFELNSGSMNGVVYENKAAAFYGYGFLYLSGLDSVLTEDQFFVQIDFSIKNASQQHATILKYCDTHLRIEGPQLILKSNVNGGSLTLSVPFEYTVDTDVKRMQSVIIALKNGLMLLKYEYKAGSNHMVSKNIPGSILKCDQPTTLGDPYGGVSNWNKVDTGFHGEIHNVEGFTCIPEHFIKTIT